MCGICGAFHFGAATGEIDPRVLARMRDTLVHRGPDDKGVWTSDDRRASLAHRRLAIVDLAPTASQPMANEDGSIWVTYNGELYNHRALRATLSARGHRFRTDHADTEVIVHAYEEWGEGCVERFEGMFAFGLVDDRVGRLWLTRDRLGVKPLYLTLRPGLLLFASEVKALLAHPDVSAALSPTALYHYFSFLTTPAPLTMFEHVYKLPAGCSLTVERDGGSRAWRYWDALPPGGRLDPELSALSAHVQEDVAARTLRGLLERAVEKRMVADVPCGVLLSGGIDSSAVVALMSRYSTGPVTTFTVGFSDHTYLNELEYARMVARRFGTTHHEVLIGEADASDYVPEMIAQLDEPVADWVCLPLFFVSRLAREHGTLVVQVGEGSDEQFCGYDHYLRYLGLQRLARQFSRLPGSVQRAGAALADISSNLSGRGSFYADAVERVATNRGLFWGGAIAFWERDKRRLLRRERFTGVHADLPDVLRPFASDAMLQQDSAGVVASELAGLERGFPSADALARMTYLECRLRLPELLLKRVDKITMSTSIEARVPFLDHALVEFTMSLPMAVKIQHATPKFLLRKAMAGLVPDSVIARPKMGFGTPMREWLRGDFGRSAEAAIMDSPLRGEQYLDYEVVADLFARHRSGSDRSLELWTIYNVSAWFDHWIAGRRGD